MSSLTFKNIAKMSAAGSGKTWDICHDALEAVKYSGKCALIVTYTNRSAEAVRNEVRKQNDGVLHPYVIIKTWYRFLLSDFIKPYQSEITNRRINHIKTIDFSEQFGQRNFHKAGTYARYISTGRNVRSNQASELAVLLNKRSGGKSIKRLEEKYSNVYFDEIQDLAGYDIELLRLLMDSSISATCCGDNKQATFKTHVTKKNIRQTGTNIWEFFRQLETKGIVQIERNLSSRRFNWDICCFANALYPEGDNITTIMDTVTEHDGVFLIKETDVELYREYFTPQSLRFDVKTKVVHSCLNFGICKGETFDRVLIYPNGPLNKFILDGIALNSPEKYYVGVTRPRYSIAFVMKILPKSLQGYETVKIRIGPKEIVALKYQCLPKPQIVISD